MSTIKSNISDIIGKAFTPILVAVVGFWLNSSVQKTQQDISKLQTDMELRIAPIKEMKPYMEMLSDTSVTKNILGAYSIYMLKKGDDSRIAAQMIASMQKDYLVDILKTLGKDDDSVQKVLDELGSNNYDLTPLEYSQFDKSTRDTLKLSSMQRYALEVKGSIEQNQLREQDFEGTSDLTSIDDLTKNENNLIMSPTSDGWIYLGEGRNLIVDLPKGEDVDTNIYKLNSATNLRAGWPSKDNNYKLQRKIRVIAKGTEVKIDVLNKEKYHYWAEVKIILKIDVLANNLFSNNKETRISSAQDIVSNANDNPSLIGAVIEKVNECLNETEDPTNDCENGLYNASLVLNDLDTNLISAHLPQSIVDNILDQIPKKSKKTRRLFEDLRAKIKK